MLDSRKVGIKISSLRKSFGYSQEKLAEILHITPQAISKWENGHALPDTALLPVLAQVFDCSIDSIIMPAYLFDEKIERDKPNILEQQAEHIAKYVFAKLEVKQAEKEQTVNDLAADDAEDMQKTDDMFSQILVEPIRFCFGCDLISLVAAELGGDLLERVSMIRRTIGLELGYIIPLVRLQDDIKLAPNRYAIYIKGIEAAGGDIIPDHIDSPSIMSNHLMEVIRKHLPELISRQDVQNMINHIKESHSVLVDELIPKYMSIGEVQKVLVKLLKEDISIRDMVTILETLADHASFTRDTDMLTEYVRASLKRAISKKFFTSGVNTVITLASALEATLTANIQKTEIGSFVNIDRELANRIFESLKKEMSKLTSLGVTPIVLASPFVRMYFKQLADEIVPDLSVISYGEIDQNVELQSIGTVTADDSPKPPIQDINL